MQVLDDDTAPSMETLVEYRDRCTQLLALVSTMPQEPVCREVEDLLIDARADVEARMFKEQTRGLDIDTTLGGAA